MDKKKLIACAGPFAAAALLTAVLLLTARGDAAHDAALSMGVLLFTAALNAALALALRSGLKTSLYTYRNAELLAALFFTVVLFGVLLKLFLVSTFRGSALSPALFFREFIAFPRRFSFWIVGLVVLLSALVFVSNLSLIRHEGFRPTNLLGAFLGGLYVLLTLVAYLVSDYVQNNTVIPLGGEIANTAASLFLLLLLCYFECAFLGVAVMGWICARHVPAYDKDFIIIPGCSISKAGGLLPLLKGRTHRAIRFAWEQEMATGRPVRYVPSGGQGPDEIMSEGSAMELYLLSHSAESDEVFPERQSSNTWENMLFSKRIIDSLQPGAKVAFSTTNYHVYRSGILARQAGMQAEGIASGTKWYFWPNGFIREFIAIMAMHKKAHLFTAVLLALLCAALGAAGARVGLL